MKMFNTTKLLLSALLIAAPILAQAQVMYPALDVMDMGSDTGSDYILGNYLAVDATAFNIVFDDGTPSLDIPDETFTLSSTFSAGTYQGSFSAGSLLSGTFTDLVVTPNGSVFGTDFFQFEATVSYTGGSLATGFSSGSMGGTFDSNHTFTAKIGEITVVPVPAAIWLFGSGLLGLVAVSRRRT